MQNNTATESVNGLTEAEVERAVHDRSQGIRLSGDVGPHVVKRIDTVCISLQCPNDFADEMR